MAPRLRVIAFGTAAIAVTPVMVFAGASLVAKIWSQRTGNVYAFGIAIGEGDEAFHLDMLSPGVASAVILGGAAALSLVWRATGDRHARQRLVRARL